MAARTCNHVRKNGSLCKALALHGRDFCYFHLTTRARRLKAARAKRRGQEVPIALPFPEDIHSVQIGLHEVMLAIAEKRIESKDAGLLLYSLQQAATNIIGSGCMYTGLASTSDEFRPIPLTAYPGFEEDYELPPGLGMTIDPNDDLSGREPHYGSDDDVDDESFCAPLPKPLSSATPEPEEEAESVA